MVSKKKTDSNFISNILFLFFLFFYKLILQNCDFFSPLYLSILISIKLGLQLRKRGKEAGRDSTGTHLILSDKYCVMRELFVCYMYYYTCDNQEKGPSNGPLQI